MLGLIALAAGTQLALQPPSAPPKAKPGFYAAHATLIGDAYFNSKPISVRSPDGQSTATAIGVKQERFEILLSGRLGRGRFKVAAGPNQELLWSPDSNALFVTADDGGMVGAYELTVIGMDHHKLVRRDLTLPLANAFGHPVRCYDNTIPNVAGVKWMGGSHRLLAAVEIPGDTNCDSMGTFKTFEIDPFAVRVLSLHGQVESKHLFRDDLGAELMAADDRCETTPRSCWVWPLHRR